MPDPLGRKSYFRSFCVAARKVGLRPCRHRFKRLPAKDYYYSYYYYHYYYCYYFFEVGELRPEQTIWLRLWAVNQANGL